MDWRIHGLMRYFMVLQNILIMTIFIVLGYINENSYLSTVGPFDNLVYRFCVLKYLVYDLHSVLVITTFVRLAIEFETFLFSKLLSQCPCSCLNEQDW